MFAVTVLLPLALLPVIKVCKCVVHYSCHLPYNLRGATQAIRQSVSKCLFLMRKNKLDEQKKQFNSQSTMF